MEKPVFDWVEFYDEFAHKLLEYKNNRTELIEKIKKIYQHTGIKMPTLEKDNQIVDIDPFTIFGLFNKGITWDNRKKILTEIAKLFDIAAAVPTSFDSLPILNSQNATYYNFIDERGERDIDDLWSFFESALEYDEDPTEENREVLSRNFDLVINKKGIANSKITMGLFWIGPSTFLNLDQRNTWYIYESGKIPKDVALSLPKVEHKIPAKNYFKLVESIRDYLKSESSPLKDFKELSLDAWLYSNQVNEEIKAQKRREEERSKGKGLPDVDVENIQYWLFNLENDQEKWDEMYDLGIIAIRGEIVVDLTLYSNQDDLFKEVNNATDLSHEPKVILREAWQFAHDMKIGDIVFVRSGDDNLIGRGIVRSEYRFQSSIYPNMPHVREINWTHKGSMNLPKYSEVDLLNPLVNISAYTDYLEKLSSVFRQIGDGLVSEEQERYEHPYTKTDFLKEVFMDEASYDRLAALLRTKKNIILQGSPGVGKTFIAKRLAYSMIGSKDQERVMMVQFHQSYSYEDFIEGFRPMTEGAGFEIKKGSFYNFCKKAEQDKQKEHFFIIDEINRGNLSKIFGELFMLIENDKRGHELQLLYSDERFNVPENVHIIGMMNTADRSLAMLDYALRRRFAFYDMKPQFENEGFKLYLEEQGNEKLNLLIQTVKNMNEAITEDNSLGENFTIGHSYFCNLDNPEDESLSNIVEYELIPLLKEYWFDESSKVKDWSERLRGAIK